MEQYAQKKVGFMMLKAKLNFIKLSLIAAALLILISWLFIFIVEDASISALFSVKNALHTKQFFQGLAGIHEEQPAFFNIESWKNALSLTYDTLMISIIAIGFSAIGMLLTVIPAARNVAEGTLTLSRKWYNWLIFGFIRCIYVFSRSVPELVWAMVIVFILKPGILPGALALALHNFGILGKLCAEVVEDLDMRPVRNLASSGASSGQLLFYGVLPAVMPKFITYILYRWEVIIRTTIVVGFVGAGGLGQQFKLSMSWFHYTDVTLILICYLLLVGFADLFSEGCRRLQK
ncbi:MAG: phosphonate transporter permease protein [Clostridia bacterium]|jgi:phosphonate transport system permease protein|nr:phosphonate transporter permease protein [Clostridia bacterium]